MGLFSEAGPPISHEASVAILELLKAESELPEGTEVTFTGTDRYTSPQTISSSIIKAVDELRVMPDGEKKTEKERKIIEQIDNKLHLAQSIAEKLRPESYSVGVGFPFGIQISFSWSPTKRGGI